MLSYAYKHTGADGLIEDRAKHRDTARELRADAHLRRMPEARAASRASYRHE